MERSWLGGSLREREGEGCCIQESLEFHTIFYAFVYAPQPGWSYLLLTTGKLVFLRS
jgi:hypothetical protein